MSNQGLKMAKHNDAWRRRHAIQMAAQLPDQYDDAVAVLGLLKEIVDNFLAPEAESNNAPRRLDQEGSLVAFPGSSSAPNRRASSNVSPSGRPL